MNNKEQVTNIFEKALFERFSKLEVGDPDENVKEAMQRAAEIVTKEVKIILNKQYDARRSRRNFN